MKITIIMESIKPRIEISVDARLHTVKGGKVTIKLWEVINQVRIHDLLLQQVLLVKEEDHRGV